MPRYLGAAVCRRGHTISAAIDLAPGPSLTVGDEPGLARYCSTCGAAVLTNCEHCGFRIEGLPEEVVVVDYEPPDFCDRCGAPHPWLSRQGRIYLLEARIESEADPDPATRLKLEDELEALRDPDISEEEELERWKRIRRYAETAWEAGGVKQIVATLITATARSKLGLE